MSTTASKLSTSELSAPRMAPKAAPVALVLSLLLCAFGVVAGRDALILFGAIAGQDWIAPLLTPILDVRAQTWMLPVGIVLAAIGFVLLVVAVLPRRRTHRLSDHDGVWIGRRASSTRVSALGRATAAVDRVASAVTGAILLAVGAAAVAWQQDRLPEPFRSARRTVDSWGADGWSSAQWWRWALIAVAVVTLLVGLRWLYAHMPRRQRTRLEVTGLVSDNDDKGRVHVDLGSAARHAAAQFEQTAGIVSATAKVTQVRGVPVLRVIGTVHGMDAPSTDLIVAASNLRDVCTSALDGLAVEVQIFLNPSRIRTDRSVPDRT